MNKIILDPITKNFIDTGEIAPRYSFGFHLPKETREKMSLSHLGKHQSRQAKEKLRLANLGKHCSEETKEKLRLANSGMNNPGYGKPRSEEVKRKISLSEKGKICKPVSNETREKLRATIKLALQDPEMKERHRLAQLGHIVSEETRRKLSIANHFPEMMDRNRELSKARWQDPDFVDRWREAQNTRPNKAELLLQTILDNYFPNTYEYVGDFQVNIGGRFPDFINKDGKKEVLELFGNHWHNPDKFPNKPTQEETIAHYKYYGHVCIIIWDEELDSPDRLVEHIRSGHIFTPNYNWKARRHHEKPSVVSRSITYNPVTKEFSYEE